MGQGVALLVLAAAIQPAVPSLAPASLNYLVSIFPRGKVVAANGPRSLADALGEVMRGIAREGGGREVEVAFVVDRSQGHNLGAALQLALAAHREALVPGRYALVICGQDHGEAKATVEVPLNADSYAVLRAADRPPWESDDSGVEASVVGLAAAAHLDWRPGGAPPQIFLLAAEAASGDLRTTAKAKPANRKALAHVANWARSSQATLFAIGTKLDEHDGRGDDASDESIEEHGRVSLRQVAGVVRDGRHVQVASPRELTSAIEDALARAASDSEGADVAFLVDLSGLMGEAVNVVRAAHSVLARFVAVKRHRLAFVVFRGKGVPAIVLPLTGSVAAVNRVARGLRRREVGDWPKDLSAVLTTARRLRWDKASKKALILLTAADAAGGIDRSLLDWTEDGRVALTVIEPLPALTGSMGRAP
jgi:hypothetical protein